ncbi:MAG: quinone-dependent dihydroorotate dehydrogenase [Hyphomicrobiaceae bacterium]
MLQGLTRLAQPLLLTLPPEAAHEATLKALERGVYPRADALDDPRIAVKAFGLDFPNPVGIAAGFDKDARVCDAILSLGCGFAEAGTITPLPQPGNPRPRVFRLIRDRAAINRLGFNSGGHEAALKRLQCRARRGIVGVNLGANKESADRIADYAVGVETFADVASYFMVNISSPNTPGLRLLQDPDALEKLLERVMEAKKCTLDAGRPAPPIIVKISADVTEDELEPIIECMLQLKVDGIAISNTTVSRAGLRDVEAGREAGGLSGRPLFERSTILLARAFRIVGGRVPLVGIGGIDSGDTALAKIEAGATLIQLYTGLIYEGAGLIGRIKRRLAAAVVDAGEASISGLVGGKAAKWASRPIEG